MSKNFKDYSVIYKGSYYPVSPESDPCGKDQRIDYELRRYSRTSAYLPSRGDVVYYTFDREVHSGTNRMLLTKHVKEIRRHLREALENFKQGIWSYPLIIRQVIDKSILRQRHETEKIDISRLQKP